MSETITTTKTNTFTKNAAGAFVATSTEAPDVAALEPDALAALLDEFGEGFDDRAQEGAYRLTSEGDVQGDSPIWQGEESYISDVEVTSGETHDDGGDWLAGTNEADGIYGLGGNDVLIGTDDFFFI